MNLKNSRALPALRAAFPFTIPILTGFIFLGVTYGVFSVSSGLSFVYPMLMSLCVFAGSAEFVAVSLLACAFNPLSAFLMTLMINMRHIIYGLAMLEKYRGHGWRTIYLIFGMCDESFSINCSASVPEGIDKGWFMFFVTMLNQLYWVLGSTLGGIFGSLTHLELKGLDFVMSAMFLVIFLEQIMKDKNRLPHVAGVAFSALCLALFGADAFIIPSMICIVLFLLVLLRLSGKREGKDDA